MDSRKNRKPMNYLFLLPAILIIPVILALFNPLLPKYFCTHFGHWHLAPKEIGFDGCSCNGVCPRCGKFVMLDSQGNWF